MGANSDSDHYLVIPRVSENIRPKYDPHKDKTMRYNISNLNKQEAR
jgi:hypothetical protein